MGGLEGHTLGRYRVLSLLGAGGMGEVYRARDTELERDVALKVLPEAAAGDPDRLERFAREARAVARLSHPNILEIYDVGHSGGVHYAVTELLEGRTLRGHLERGRLPVRKAVVVADAVARGLGAAHAQGVVHRDVKPENVLLTTDGRVKVLDFGIASLHAPELADDDTDTPESTTVTAAGALIGTVGYMSPEQVRGEAADARSDVFSLGCVLYEMLTGERAFRRATPAESLVAVLHDEPTPPSALTTELPSGIDRVVMRCLEKEPGERFQSAADVAFALRAAEGSRGHRVAKRPATARRRGRRVLAAALLGAAAVVAAGLAWRYATLAPPPVPQVKHLAVLDFTTGSRDPRLRQLAAGLAATTSESLLPVLAQTRGRAWAVPRRSMTANVSGSIEALRRKYNVNLGVTGRLESSGSRLRLDLAVVDATRNLALARSSIEDELDNLGSFQLEPVLSIARMIGVPVGSDTLELLRARTTNHTVALSSYLRARGLVDEPTGDADTESPESLLREAIAADPRFLPARESLAALYLERWTATSQRAWIDKGLESVEEIMSRSPTEHASLVESQLLSARGDHAAAARTLAAAVRRSPADGHLHIELGNAYRASHQPVAAARSLERAVNLLPGYWPALYWLGLLDYEQGRYDAAANAWREVTRLAPEYDGGYTNLGLAYYMLDRRDEARGMLERALELTGGDDYVVLSNLGTLYFEDSRYGEAADLFEQAVQLFDGHHTVWGNLGQAYAATQDPERAQRPFRRAIELAEAALATDPENPELLAALASYRAMLGEREAALGHLEASIARDPGDPAVMAMIGETYEDLGLRDEALHWVARALARGVPPSRFSNHPSARGLIDDPRYRQLVAEAPDPRQPRTEGSEP